MIQAPQPLRFRGSDEGTTKGPRCFERKLVGVRKQTQRTEYVVEVFELGTRDWVETGPRLAAM